MSITIPEPSSVSPFVLKNVDLVIDADNFAAHVSSVAWVPSASTQTFKGLSPAGTRTDTGVATWVANLTFAQDWDDDSSLSNYLLEHEGETVDAVFVPRSGSGKGFTAALTITPGQIGGDGDAFATSTVSLGSTKPAKVTIPTA